MSLLRSVFGVARPLSRVPVLSRAASSSAGPSSSSFPSTSSPASSPSYTSSPSGPWTGKLDNASHLIPQEYTEKVDAWWTRGDIDKNHGSPGNQFTGRSIPVKGSYMDGYRRLMSVLNKASVRRELRHMQYHEKPGDKKRRLASERHRKRFQEEIRKRVQLVEWIRARK